MSDSLPSDGRDGDPIHPAIRHVPDPAHPGWWTWDIDGPERFNHAIAPLLVRRDEDGRGWCRMFPEERHANLGGFVHGGATQTLIDSALFAGGAMIGATVGRAVTLECSTQFLAPAKLGLPLDAEVELLRETGRLAFFRGRVLQGSKVVAAFAGTLRKMKK